MTVSRAKRTHSQKVAINSLCNPKTVKFSHLAFASSYVVTNSETKSLAKSFSSNRKIICVFQHFRNVLSAMKVTSIEVCEWRRADVIKKRLPNNPNWANFAQNNGPLELTGIRLAHAVVRADFLQLQSFLLPSLGFVLQMDQIIDFRSSSNLRLLPGASSILSDVSQSSLAGRIGQGLSILFAEKLGYSFCHHLSSDPNVRAHLAGSGPARVADFMFENGTKDRMILESKASFSLQSNDCSPVKAILKAALEQQVDPTMRMFSPSPSKGFAVYSCLRESGNLTPSSIIFVDPPEQDGEFPLNVSPDTVRRQNYAGWLKAMGLHAAATRLISAQEGIEGKVEELLVTKIGDHSFAFVERGLYPKRYLCNHPVFGIEVNALKAVSKTLEGTTDALLEHQPLSIEEVKLQRHKSVMSDGTLFGFLDPRDFEKISFESFSL